MLRQRLQSFNAAVGWTRLKVTCAVQSWSVGKSRRPRRKDEKLGREDVLSPMAPSAGLKMLVSTMMTGHDNGTHTDGPMEMATWDVSRAHLYGDARRCIHPYLLQGYEQKGKLARLWQSMF